MKNRCECKCKEIIEDVVEEMKQMFSFLQERALMKALWGFFRKVESGKGNEYLGVSKESVTFAENMKKGKYA